MFTVKAPLTRSARVAPRDVPAARDQEASLSRAVPILVFLLAFAHAGVYSLLIPPWQSPDEPFHVEYVLAIAKHGFPIQYTVDRKSGDSTIQTAIVTDMLEHDY